MARCRVAGSGRVDRAQVEDGSNGLAQIGIGVGGVEIGGGQADRSARKSSNGAFEATREAGCLPSASLSTPKVTAARVLSGRSFQPPAGAVAMNAPFSFQSVKSRGMSGSFTPLRLATSLDCSSVSVATIARAMVSRGVSARATHNGARQSQEVASASKVSGWVVMEESERCGATVGLTGATAPGSAGILPASALVGTHSRATTLCGRDARAWGLSPLSRCGRDARVPGADPEAGETPATMEKRERNFVPLPPTSNFNHPGSWDQSSIAVNERVCAEGVASAAFFSGALNLPFRNGSPITSLYSLRILNCPSALVSPMYTFLVK